MKVKDDPDDDLVVEMCEACGVKECAPCETLCAECLADEYEEDDYWDDICS